MDRQPAVYMLANRRLGTLYIGVTSNLVARVWQHREHVVDGFTQRHSVDRLVWFELHGSMEAAIVREAAEEMAARLEDAVDRRAES